MERKIFVETSARHVHLSQDDLEALFGKGYSLTPKKYLSQPDQFASEERVNISGPKGEIKNVVILGPVRKSTQVEVSLTDARTLGITVPVRESGDTAGSAACTISGPKGSITLSEGVIAAKRHIHLAPDEAAVFGLSDKQVVQVKLTSKGRSLVFGDVVVRVSDRFAAAMHIDTDEANAAGLSGAVYGEIIP